VIGSPARAAYAGVGDTVPVSTASRDLRTVAIVLVWIPAVLWLDRTASPVGQLLLGAGTWLLLLALLRAESHLVRVQTGVVIVIATIIEYVFSGWLGVYVYRLDEVPAYVPPGHGLVYLAAFAFARLPVVRRHARLAVTATVVVASAWAFWGLLVSERTDVLGFFWYLCLLAFLRWGRSTLLYVGAFVVVSYLEILGTAWGVWAWAERDTILGWVPMGNPPSIAAGGYGWFDLYAVLLAPAILDRWYAWRGRRPAVTTEASSVQGRDDGVVEQTVAGDAAAAVGTVDAVDAREPAARLGDHQ
jgi:hypothetical protein